MNSRILIGAMLGLTLAWTLAVESPVRAGDATVIAKTFDLTKNYQIPAAGDTVVTGPTSTPASGAIALAATAGLRTACVYSRVIDLTAPQDARPETTTGPAKGVAGMSLWASQASGTVGVSVTALYGVAQTMLTTPVDLSSTTADDRLSFYADAFGTQAAQTDKTKIRWYTGQRPRTARFVRFLLENKGGVALTIPTNGWQYVSP